MHSLAVEAAQAAFRRVNGGQTVDLSSDGWSAWEQLTAIRKNNAENDKAEKQLKAILLAELKEAEFGRLPNGDCVKRTMVTRKAFSVAESTFPRLSLVKGS